MSGTTGTVLDPRIVALLHQYGQQMGGPQSANPNAADTKGLHSATFIPNEEITTVFEATVQATEESITNALVAAETMTGANDLRVTALPHDRLRAALQKYGRLGK